MGGALKREQKGVGRLTEGEETERKLGNKSGKIIQSHPSS